MKRKFILPVFCILILFMPAKSYCFKKTLPPAQLHFIFLSPGFPVRGNSISGEQGYPFLRNYIFYNLLPLTRLLEKYDFFNISIVIPPEILPELKRMEKGKMDRFRRISEKKVLTPGDIFFLFHHLDTLPAGSPERQKALYKRFFRAQKMVASDYHKLSSVYFSRDEWRQLMFDFEYSTIPYFIRNDSIISDINKKKIKQEQDFIELHSFLRTRFRECLESVRKFVREGRLMLISAPYYAHIFPVLNTLIDDGDTALIPVRSKLIAVGLKEYLPGVVPGSDFFYIPGINNDMSEILNRYKVKYFINGNDVSPLSVQISKTFPSIKLQEATERFRKIIDDVRFMSAKKNPARENVVINTGDWKGYDEKLYIFLKNILDMEKKHKTILFVNKPFVSENHSKKPDKSTRHLVKKIRDVIDETFFMLNREMEKDPYTIYGTPFQKAIECLELYGMKNTPVTSLKEKEFLIRRNVTQIYQSLNKHYPDLIYEPLIDIPDPEWKKTGKEYVFAPPVLADNPFREPGDSERIYSYRETPSDTYYKISLRRISEYYGMPVYRDKRHTGNIQSIKLMQSQGRISIMVTLEHPMTDNQTLQFYFHTGKKHNTLDVLYNQWPEPYKRVLTSAAELCVLVKNGSPAFVYRAGNREWQPVENIIIPTRKVNNENSQEIIIELPNKVIPVKPYDVVSLKTVLTVDNRIIDVLPEEKAIPFKIFFSGIIARRKYFDPGYDDYGPGYYYYPYLAELPGGTLDLVSAGFNEDRNNYIFTLEFRNIVRDAKKKNGVDFALIDLYLNTSAGGDTRSLPGRNFVFDNNEGWEYAVTVSPDGGVLYKNGGAKIMDLHIRAIPDKDFRSVYIIIPRYDVPDLKIDDFSFQVTSSLYSKKGIYYVSDVAEKSNNSFFYGKKLSTDVNIIDVLMPAHIPQTIKLTPVNEKTSVSIPFVRFEEE